MKVIILTEGGEDLGLGHITRCYSILQAFLEVGTGTEINMLIDGEIPKFIKTAKTNIKTFNWKEQFKYTLKLTGQSDIVIVDSYLLESNRYSALAETTKLLVAIDDFGRFDYPSGIVVNFSIATKEIKYPEKSNTIYLLGTKYVPVRKAFWEHKEYCDKKNVIFFATPFDFDAVDELDSLGVPLFKIASFEIVDLKLVEYVAKKREPIIISTGLANKVRR